jgi:hypothetical protein
MTLFEFTAMVEAFINSKYNYRVVYTPTGNPDAFPMEVMNYMVASAVGGFKYGSIQYNYGQAQINANMTNAVKEANLRYIVFLSNSAGKGMPPGLKSLLDSYQIPAVYSNNQMYQSAINPPPESFYFGSFGSVPQSQSSGSSMAQASMGSMPVQGGMASTTSTMTPGMDRMSRMSAAMGGIPGRIVGPGFTYPAGGAIQDAFSNGAASQGWQNQFVNAAPSWANQNPDKVDGFSIPGDDDSSEAAFGEGETPDSPLQPPSAEHLGWPNTVHSESSDSTFQVEEVSPIHKEPNTTTIPNLDISRLGWFPGIESL